MVDESTLAGSSNTGTGTGTGTGTTAYILSLDGVDDKVEFPNVDIPFTAKTVEAFVMIDSAARIPIFSVSKPPDSEAHNDFEIDFILDTTGSAATLAVTKGNEIGCTADASTVTVSSLSPTHLAWVTSTGGLENNDWSFYINGIKVEHTGGQDSQCTWSGGSAPIAGTIGITAGAVHNAGATGSTYGKFYLKQMKVSDIVRYHPAFSVDSTSLTTIGTPDTNTILVQTFQSASQPVDFNEESSNSWEGTLGGGATMVDESTLSGSSSSTSAAPTMVPTVTSTLGACLDAQDPSWYKGSSTDTPYTVPSTGEVLDPSKMFDGDASTWWNPIGGGVGSYFDVDFGTEGVMTEITWWNNGDTGHDATSVELQWFKSGTYTTFATIALPAGTSAPQVRDLVGLASEADRTGTLLRLRIAAMGSQYQPTPREVSFGWGNCVIVTPSPTVVPTIGPSVVATEAPTFAECLDTQDPSWYQGSTSRAPYSNAGITYDPAKLFDGLTTTFWNPTGGGSGYWFEVNFGSEVVMDGITWQNLGDTTHDATSVQLQWINSGTYTTFATITLTAGTSAPQFKDLVGQNSEAGRTGSQLRINIVSIASQYQPYVTEVIFHWGNCVIGTPSSTEMPTTESTNEPTHPDGTIPYELRVAMKTCTFSASGSPNTNYLVSFALDLSNNLAITAPSKAIEVIPGAVDTWYLIYSETIRVPEDDFISPVESTLLLTSTTDDGLCVAEVTVNGVAVETGTLPGWIDTPYSGSYVGGSCYPTGLSLNFFLTPPTRPTYVTFTTCAEVGFAAGVTSADQCLVELTDPGNDLKLLTDFTPSAAGGSHTMVIYQRAAILTQPLVVTILGGDGWCVESVSIYEGMDVMESPQVWLDAPCSSAQYDGVDCSPTLSLEFSLPMILSKSYAAKNLYAFAALDANDAIFAWGASRVGGDAQYVPPTDRTLTEIVPGVVSFVGRTTTGTLVAWGNEHSYVNVPADTIVTSNTLAANEAAYAALTDTGGVVSFGDAEHGGNLTVLLPALQTVLSAGVSSLVASSGTFLALMSDGTVNTWGNTFTGAGMSTLVDSSLTNVQACASTRMAFACRKADGSVVTWGSAISGGDSTAVASLLASDVIHIIGSKSAFAAFKSDGSLVTWGHPTRGGDSSSVAAGLTSGVKFVTYTDGAFAALKEDGTVVTWGDEALGGDSSAVGAYLVGVSDIYSNGGAFAALTTSGAVIVWGDADSGGEIDVAVSAQLASGIASVYATRRAFAALTNNGTVVAWGNPYQGGDTSDVQDYFDERADDHVYLVCSNDVAFTAFLSTGKVVAWGHSTSLGATGGQLVADDSTLYSSVESCIY